MEMQQQSNDFPSARGRNIRKFQSICGPMAGHRARIELILLDIVRPGRESPAI
jgi:hypothetical protein